MIRYLAARAIAASVPGCRLSGIDLPDWGIRHPEIPPGEDTSEVRVDGLETRIDRAKLVAGLAGRRSDRMRLDSRALHIDNFPAREDCAALFEAAVPELPGFGRDHLVIQLCDATIPPGAPSDTFPT